HTYSGGEWFFLQDMDIEFLSRLQVSNFFDLKRCFEKVQTMLTYLESLDRYSVNHLPTNAEIYEMREQYWYKGKFIDKVGFIYGLKKIAYLASQSDEDQFAVDLNEWIRDFSRHLA